MKHLFPLSKKMEARLFWDINMSKMDAESNSRLIIERIFSLGTIDEIRAAIEYYGVNKTIDTLAGINYLDPKTLNFVSKIFNKPKEEFKCYKKKQSAPQHWNS